MAQKILIRVTPKAAANRVKIETAEDGSVLYRVYVTCVPEDGKANEAVIALIAKQLKISKSRLEIIKGTTSRDKIIAIL